LSRILAVEVARSELLLGRKRAPTRSPREPRMRGVREWGCRSMVRLRPPVSIPHWRLYGFIEGEDVKRRPAMRWRSTVGGES
jgi:hypothetical protein